MNGLMIIDMQKGFINHNTENIIDQIAKLRTLFASDHCIITKFINHNDSMYVKQLHWKHLIAEDEQTLVLPFHSQNLLIEKETYSAVNDTLKQFIAEKNIDTIYLCGVDIDSCVLATAFALFDIGIKPIFVSDCCASYAGDKMVQASWQIIRRSFGKDCIQTYQQVKEQEGLL